MDTSHPHSATPAMADALRAQADTTGTLSFAAFSAVALFAPQIGYYTSQRQRVGLNDASDFYTASSVGPVFGQLVAEAAAARIAPAAVQDFALVEIGAERDNGVFQQLASASSASGNATVNNPEAITPDAAASSTGNDTDRSVEKSAADTDRNKASADTASHRNLQSGSTDKAQDTAINTAAPHLSGASPTDSGYVMPPFAQVLTLPLGDAWNWPERAVIFANELLDAQPFHRLQYLDGRWREWGVRCDDSGLLHETLLPDFSPEVANRLAKDLPRHMPEGYRLDISLAAEALLADLLQRNWQGAFLLFDYGRLWQELLTNCPAGTARAYHSHRLSTDLLANTGAQDLTCHVCWDRLERIALQHGFQPPQLDRQESFFMRHSQQTIARIIGKAPERFDPDRQALMSLLHPTHLGSKFQVLHAVRGG